MSESESALLGFSIATLALPGLIRAGVRNWRKRIAYKGRRRAGGSTGWAGYWTLGWHRASEMAC